MKVNLLKGLLAASLTFGVVAGVTSCKDTNEDLYAQLRDENGNLEKKLNDEISLLRKTQEELKLAQEKCKKDCEEAWQKFKETGFKEMLDSYVKSMGEHETLAWYLQQIDNALKDADGNTYTSLQERLNQMQNRFKDVNTRLTDAEGRLTDAEGRLTDAEGRITDTETRLTTVETTLNLMKTNLNLNEVQELLKDWNTDLPTVLTEAHDAWATAQENQEILKALLKGYTEAGDENKLDMTKITGLIKTLEDAASEAKSLAEEAKQAVVTLQNKLYTYTDEEGVEHKGDINDLQDRVSSLETRVSTLETQVSALTGRLNKLVTGIVLQQVSNEVYGKFSMPFDVNSKLLIAYCGDASNVTFPAFGSSANEYNNQVVLGSADNTGVKPQRFNGVLGVENDQLALGKIYLSVNPAGLDVSGATWQLVNSQGKQSAVELSPLTASDEELTFGYGTRAQSEQTYPNGFYVTTASVKEDRISDIRFTLSSDFETDVKNAFDNITAGSLLSLARVMSSQVNNKLTANGVRAGWTYKDENGNDVADATYSEFGIAATAVKPLSYKFLYGHSFRQLPTITPLEDFEFNEKLTITMPDFSFDFDDVSLGFSFDKNIDVDLSHTEITVVIPAMNIYEVVNGQETGKIIGTTKEETVTVDDLTNLESAIETALKSSLTTSSTELKESFKEAMGEIASKIDGQLDEKMKELKTDIENQFDNIINSLENKVNGYFGTVNNYIDKVNGYLNRINRVLADPNHYLQVTMLYRGNNSRLHQLSNSSVLPSQFVIKGGDGIELYPTSYSAEVVAPSFRKFIAVTRVTGNKTAAELEALKNEANSLSNFNEVIPGYTRAIAFKIPAAAKGCTYEIAYSSLDYHGVTSTRKFYLSVE